jgi:hypothetical protein
MRIPVAVEFLCWLQSTGLFHCACGETRLFNIWNMEQEGKPVPFDKGDREFLWRMLGKPSNYTNCSHNRFASLKSRAAMGQGGE